MCPWDRELIIVQTEAACLKLLHVPVSALTLTFYPWQRLLTQDFEIQLGLCVFLLTCKHD